MHAQLFFCHRLHKWHELIPELTAYILQSVYQRLDRFVLISCNSWLILIQHTCLFHYLRFFLFFNFTPATYYISEVVHALSF